MGNFPACHVSSTECMSSKLFGLIRVKVSLIPRPETDEHVDCKNMSTGYVAGCRNIQEKILRLSSNQHTLVMLGL